MTVKFLLDKKREGHALTTGEIRDLVAGFVAGDVPDCQMSAFAMAVCCRGMNDRETADLTDAMMRSGRLLEWPAEPPTADKHSTGGVGDKLSLVIQPLAASCGLVVPSLTGRGLGITGGTADKLESIPGYSCSQTLERFAEIARTTGVSMAVQTDEICPADKKLYALRDVTGTVASIPLIVGSILSKKLAEGAGTLVFDVKCGTGAFMKTPDEAKELANALVVGARAAGRRSAALVTAMDAPLGCCVGNALEIEESLELLRGRCDEQTDLAVEFAALMVSLARGLPLADARSMARDRLADGSAFRVFAASVKAHGGDLDAFSRTLEKPVHKFRISAMRSGFVTAIDAQRVGRVALGLGAGRAVATDRIDVLAGVTLSARIGNRVAVGTPLATLQTASRPDALEREAAELLKAFSISPEQPPMRDLILERIS